MYFIIIVYIYFLKRSEFFFFFSFFAKETIRIYDSKKGNARLIFSAQAKVCMIYLQINLNSIAGFFPRAKSPTLDFFDSQRAYSASLPIRYNTSDSYFSSLLAVVIVWFLLQFFLSSFQNLRNKVSRKIAALSLNRNGSLRFWILCISSSGSYWFSLSLYWALSEFWIFNSVDGIRWNFSV